MTQLEKELEQIKWDIIGLSEVRRQGEKLWKLKSEHMFVGEENVSVGGTGFLVHKRHYENILSFKKISSRVIYITLRLNKRFIKVIQVYAPTTGHNDKEVKAFYEDIHKAWREQKTHFTILCGDFNANIGVKADILETCLGNFGLEKRNKRGEALLEFLLQHNLFLMNSFFHKKLNRRWTWKSPDQQTKNEIDFIITDKR